MNRGYLTVCAGALLIVLAPRGVVSGQSGIRFVAIGDSIGEAVQSADANVWTQPFSLNHLVGIMAGASVPLPLIQTNPLAAIFSVAGRTRIAPSIESPNLAVSGADVGSVLRDRADALTVGEIDSETDLVLFPRVGSQIEIAEALRPEIVLCWIGHNNALGAVTSFDQLDASQLTSTADFAVDFQEIARRLDALGSKVVFGTLPDISRIAILLDNDELSALLGYDAHLPPGHWTTVPTMFLMKLGVLNATILTDPNYVLDPGEAATISARIAAFNQTIRNTAASHGMAVAEIGYVYDLLDATPLVVAGVPLTTRFLGGLFSLDAVHPSNIGQALAAMVFIDALNATYGLGIPQLNAGWLLWTFLTDPFIDKDGDGRVTGRFGAGILETLAPALGVAGDSDDFRVDAATPAADSTASLQASYEKYTGRSLKLSPRREHIDTVRRMFGQRVKSR